MKRNRRVFNPEFKQEAVEHLQRCGQSTNQIANELGVDQTTPGRWHREAGAAPAGENGFQAREEVKQLRREVERLRMERDILKKAVTFFAKESR